MNDILFLVLLLLWIVMGPIGLIMWLIEVMRPKGDWSYERNNPERAHGSLGWLLFSVAVTLVGGFLIFTAE